MGKKGKLRRTFRAETVSTLLLKNTRWCLGHSNAAPRRSFQKNKVGGGFSLIFTFPYSRVWLAKISLVLDT